MSTVLVILESAGGKLRTSSMPGVTCGKELAAKTGGELHLLVLGTDAQAVAKTVASEGYGAAKVHACADAKLEPFTGEAWASAVVAAVKATGATAFGGTATSTLREVIPRAAALLDAPMAVEISAVDGADSFTRPVSAGRALQKFQVASTPFGFTARASEFEPAAPGGPAAAVADLTAGDIASHGAEIVGLERTESSRPALTEADVVVAGGRGMRDADGFKVLEELTDLLGGALGATRAATDAGMVPADLQVGQTGKVVAPDLYVGVAISGAIQHLAGMKSSKTIVAINKDPEAPIFQVADYGLVAKWEDTLRPLVDLIKEHKASA
jgi:electron transfer flavoprotein alpha subunit